MLQILDIFLSLITGILIGGGWWIFIDGAISSQDAFPVLHIIPPLLIMLCAIMVNAVDPNNTQNNQVKVWLFVWFTLSCISIGFAIWITAVEYPPTENWPGVAIILMTVMVFMAALIFFASRKNGIGGGGEF